MAKVGQLYSNVDDGGLTLGYRRDSFVRETFIKADKKGEIRRGRVRVQGEDRGPVVLVRQLRRHGAGAPGRYRGDRAPRIGRDPAGSEPDKDLAAWVASAPQLVATWEPLSKIYRRSMVDLAALRFETGIAPGALPAAGLPWFMAVFGRDSVLTSFQSLPFAPELARATLRALAILQARTEDPFRDAEPGKILHEIRLGELTAFEERPQSPYYGAADTTMLFLILLEEYERWTGDKDLARELEREARAALGLDRPLRRSRQGRLRRVRAPHGDRPRQPVLEGLVGFDRLRGRHDRADAARHLRAARLRLRRQAAAARVWRGRSGTIRRWADRLDTRGGGAEAALQPGLLDPRARASSRSRSTGRSARSIR